jgi:hypothetical protein
LGFGLDLDGKPKTQKKSEPKIIHTSKKSINPKNPKIQKISKNPESEPKKYPKIH